MFLFSAGMFGCLTKKTFFSNFMGLSIAVLIHENNNVMECIGLNLCHPGEIAN